MKQIAQNQGLVLKTSDYKEQAVIATILTKNGINNYIIKGAKKISGGTRLLTIVPSLISFSSTINCGLNTITEGTLLKSYLEIKNDLKKMLYTQAIIEKILIFSPQVTDSLIFYNFIIELFDMLNTQIDPLILEVIFELKLTYLIGIAPNVNRCLKCGERLDDGVFSVVDGGVYHRRCVSSSIDLNEEQTKILKLLYLIKLKNVDNQFYSLVKDDLDDISKIVDYYYRKHLDFSSNSKKIINEILGKKLEKKA